MSIYLFVCLCGPPVHATVKAESAAMNTGEGFDLWVFPVVAHGRELHPKVTAGPGDNTDVPSGCPEQVPEQCLVLCQFLLSRLKAVLAIDSLHLAPAGARQGSPDRDASGLKASS